MLNKKISIFCLALAFITGSVFAVTEFGEYKKEMANNLNLAEQTLTNGSRDQLSAAKKILSLAKEMKAQTGIQQNSIPEDVCGNRAFFLREVVEDLDVLEASSEARVNAGEGLQPIVSVRTGKEDSFEAPGPTIARLQKLIDSKSFF